MEEVIGVSFKRAGKIYYFDPDDIEVENGDQVIVETSRGVEMGEVVIEKKKVEEEEIVSPLKKVIRKATLKDIDQDEKNKELEDEAYDIALEKIKEHGLPMKLIDVEYTFDHNKVIFYFTADGRVDFRELVKDLARVFKTRIELRQIGVRDEAKMVGGLGPCGRRTCCDTWLRDFDPVSIQLAKDQELALNPAKISGLCGRLMCCLKYESEYYEEIKKEMPNQGEKITLTNGSKAEVVDRNLIKQVVKLKNKDGDIIKFSLEEIKKIKEKN
ncbi:MAG: stage 0 sporulation family protein [Halanaerobiales bacterium]|nr:stage 0 sporulation family protein [Halanaerobiales bacterium]